MYMYMYMYMLIKSFYAAVSLKSMKKYGESKNGQRKSKIKHEACTVVEWLLGKKQVKNKQDVYITFKMYI